ncbi:TetR/AcrR family transcriptional regulator [Oceanobacter mangrovi]|uniref:TetR/AcrR family transcriptional regulator n=1 Tax=Oceanobacter mangrovi TaxID=2862510 RepID=UPI001C8DB811|nr:TetR/AcrR family transcriptional regulator [Oceanobacter mangrovi]
MSDSRDQILDSLAFALVNSPRATLKDLAEAVGISKATLHRMFGVSGDLTVREDIEACLVARAQGVVADLTTLVDQPIGDYRQTLQTMIRLHFENKEVLRYIVVCLPFEELAMMLMYQQALDRFILRGQQAGIFRIDLAMPVLSEFFGALIGSMIDAERRGRVAPAQVADAVEQFFYYGALNPGLRSQQLDQEKLS